MAANNVWDGTDWNPRTDRVVFGNDCYERTDCRGVWIDGFDPSGYFQDTSDGIILAVNAKVVVRREHPVSGALYDDIDDWDILFNTAGPGHVSFTYSSTGSSDPNIFDFQGVLTHELGHAISLRDLGTQDNRTECFSGSTIHTMCGFVNGVESTQQRTLTSDDSYGANSTY